MICKYPILLVHGFNGFLPLIFKNNREVYFRTVPEHLRKLGVKVYFFDGLPTCTIKKRAMELCKFLKTIKEDKVNIIAHSMGGLDARCAISRLGCESHVASLTTINTPHHGVEIADSVSKVRVFSRGPFSDWLDAIEVLTPWYLKEFNEVAKDSSDVKYFSIISYIHGVWGFNPALLITDSILKKYYPWSDGIVTVSSQKWGEVIKTIKADHWQTIGWGTLNVSKLYEDIINKLGERGF